VEEGTQPELIWSRTAEQIYEEGMSGELLGLMLNGKAEQKTNSNRFVGTYLDGRRSEFGE
jgi:hypothetical protein